MVTLASGLFGCALSESAFSEGRINNMALSWYHGPLINDPVLTFSLVFWGAGLVTFLLL